MVTSRAHRTVQVAATQAWRQALKWTCDITYYSYKDISKSNSDYEDNLEYDKCSEDTESYEGSKESSRSEESSSIALESNEYDSSKESYD